MRARAVWAAVQSCAFVIAFAAFWQEPTQSAVVPPAKAGYVFIAPNIFVNDATVKPKTTFPLIDGISGTLVNYARNPMLEQKPLTLFVFSIWNAASGRDHDFLIPRNIWRICKSRWQSGPDSNVSGDFLHKGWRFSKVLKMKSDEWIGCLNQGRPTLWIKSRFQNFLKVFFVNNEQKPSSFCPDLSFSGCLSCSMGLKFGLTRAGCADRRLRICGLRMPATLGWGDLSITTISLSAGSGPRTAQHRRVSSAHPLVRRTHKARRSPRHAARRRMSWSSSVPTARWTPGVDRAGSGHSGAPCRSLRRSRR